MMLVVVLPLPPAELSPNSRAYWAARARKSKRYRTDAYYAAVAARRVAGHRTFLQATVEPVFYCRDRRRRDADNALASLKAAFDGLADAGVVTNDEELSYLPVRFEVDRTYPRVEINIRGRCDV